MKSLLLLLLIIFIARKECAAQEKTIDSLRLLLGTCKADTTTIKVLTDISNYYRNKQPDTGLAYGKRALELAEKIKWQPGIAVSYMRMGSNYVMLSDANKALEVDQKAHALYEKLHDSSGVGRSLNSIGSVYLFILSDYQKALGYLERSLKVLEPINDKSGVAMDLDNLGIAYEIMGDNEKSLQYFQQAERKNEELGDKAAMATNSNHLAILYTDLKEYPKALDYCKKALDLFTATDNKVGVANALNSIGTIYMSTNKYHEALPYYQNAVNIDEQIGRKLGSAQVLANIGLVYAGLRNYREALKFYQRSFDLEKELGDKSDMASNLSNMSYIYINAPDSFMNRLGYPGTKRYSIAAKTVQQSLKLTREIGDLYTQRFSLKFLSTIYANEQDYADAYETYKQYVLVNDSIYTDEKQKQITHKELEYEYTTKEQLLKAKQDKKNALAAAEINRQKIIRNYSIAGVAVIALFSFFMIVAYNKRKKAKFDRQVSEVEMQSLRLQMNPHFIFNCMHSINKYVIDNEKQLASDFLIRFSKLMRLILENSRKNLIPVKSDLLTLELYMQLEALRFKHKFNYSITVDPAIDTEKTLIPPMLLQPFVENSIVHGIQNRAGGRIKINISNEGLMIRCTVQDNGIGRKQAALFKSTKETKKESLGLKITQERLQIISQLKKVKTAIFMEDLTCTETGQSGFRVDVLLPLETEF
jgi:tetratricopeptide (TPR) repeat protein